MKLILSLLFQTLSSSSKANSSPFIEILKRNSASVAAAAVYFSRSIGGDSLSSTMSHRNKPFVVICGCTGTGKTKLSIELAQWLIASAGRKAEIINADAMQLYKNLDIITNKATHEEMKGIKHHLIGYLDSTCISNVVTDYKNKAVHLIDSLLENDVIPILVGGTHYYIQSVLWDILIDRDDFSTTDSTSSSPPKHKLDLNEQEKQSDIVRLIVDCLEEKRNLDAKKDNASIGVVKPIDLNVRLHDSNVSNEEIYKQLERVDLQSAQKIHPNDRRKLCRALEIYYTYGTTKSELLDIKNKVLGTSFPLRYKNVCLFVLTCETQTLNKRLDDRVDKMIDMGLLKEIEEFKVEFEKNFKGQTFREYSRDFEFGIFQSIGFKEFEDYFKFVDNEQSSNDVDYETKKKDLFEKCVTEMKQSTRRYARIQMRWLYSNSSTSKTTKGADKDSPIVHELDTTDLDNWKESIFEKATKTFNDYLSRYEHDNSVQLNRRSAEIKSNEIFEYNKCEICDKIFINKDQWKDHLNGAKHKNRKEKLKREEARKLAEANVEST